jgi:hypothetical protein
MIMTRNTLIRLLVNRSGAVVIALRSTQLVAVLQHLQGTLLIVIVSPLVLLVWHKHKIPG